MIRLVAFLTVCLSVLPATADDTAEANRLMIEAIGFVDAVAGEPAAEAKIDLLRQAHDNLTAIVERYPSTDLAVRLATGQRIGTISLERVRRALDEALLARPREPGAPVLAWRHGAGVAAASFLRGGRRALTVGRDGIAAVRDVGTGDVLTAWQHGSRVTVAAVSPDGRRVLSAGVDGSASLHDARKGTLLETWRNQGALASAALFSGGRHGLVGLWSTVYLIGIEDRTELHTWRLRAPVTSVALSPDGIQVLMGLADGDGVLGDAETGAVLYRWEHPGSGGGGLMAAAFSPDGRRVLTGAANGTAVLHDTRTGKLLHLWEASYGDRVTSVAYSRSGRWVLTGSEAYGVELHEVETGRTLRKWRYDARVEALAFSPDDRQVLMGFGDGAVILCDLRVPRESRYYLRTALNSEGGCW